MLQFFNSAIVRLPIYPYNEFTKINQENFLNEILENDFFLYQIAVSSPHFYNEIKNENKIKSNYAVLKYYSRACNRCTPFGIFAGNLIINTNSDNNHETAIIDDYDEIIRLDSALVYKLLYFFDNSIRNDCSYFSNTSAYEIVGQIRYIDYILNENGFRAYKLSAINANPILKEIIKQGRSARTIQEYIDIVLKVFPDFSNAEVESYLVELIEANFLRSEIDYFSIGDRTTEEALVDFFKQKSKQKEYIFIKNILDDISAIPTIKDYRSKLYHYTNLINGLKNNFKSKSYFHHDVYFKTKQKFSLNNKQKKLIQQGYEVIQLLKDNDISTNSRLQTFTQAFYEKYENNPVSLTEALDVEIGIGYGNLLKNSNIGRNPLIEGLHIFSNINQDSSTLKWNNRDNFFINKIKSTNNKIVILSQNDLMFFKKDENKKEILNTPTTTLKCSIYKNDNKDVIHMISVNGSASKIIGRFTNNEDIKVLAKEITEYEQVFFKNHTLAEIIHIPENKIGNIVQRNIKREAEIPYLSNPTNSNSIFVDNLYLQYINGTLNIFDKITKKNIIPIFSNAFNSQYPSNLPIIDFLLDVQDQYNIKNNAYLNVEKYLKFYNHIPRFQYLDNIILSLEMWRLTIDDFINCNSDIDEYIKSLKVPRFFYIVEDDNTLLIDSGNNEMREILLSELKKKKELIITEFLDESFSSVFKNDLSKSFSNEIIIPVKLNSRESASHINNFKLTKIKQEFFPNSEWIYYKIIVAQNFSNELIIELINYCEHLKSENIIETFFYIKYFSPDFHIRLRIRSKNTFQQHIYNNIDKILKKYISKKIISKVQIDTYCRELARYGYEKITLFEDIFQGDSILCKAILKKTISDENSLWKYTISSILGYCKLLGLVDEQLVDFSTKMYKNLSNEFYHNSNTNKEYNFRYKTIEKEIIEIIKDEKNKYNSFFISNIASIKEDTILYLKKRSNEEKFYYLDSIIHMHIIRTVNSQNRFYEMLMYFFLKKSLTTCIIVNKKLLL